MNGKRLDRALTAREIEEFTAMIMWWKFAGHEDKLGRWFIMMVQDVQDGVANDGDIDDWHRWYNEDRRDAGL